MKKRIPYFFILMLMLIFLFPLNADAASGKFKFATAVSLDGRPYPEYDYSRANKLPAEMTGYWEKSFDVNGITRTAKVYISSETPIRSYYTVIAVPDDIGTAEFLWKAGWIDMADRKGEGLFVLEPGPAGWGGYEDELDYVNAAMSFYISNRYFSIFGEHYLVGYGAGAPALEAWAVANPLKVISQVYLDSTGLAKEYLDEYAAMEFDGTTAGNYVNVEFPEGFDLINYNEVVLPTWYINPDESAADSIAYWKGANDCVATGVKDNRLGRVYNQADLSERWMTSYMGSISKVAVLNRHVSYWSKKRHTDIQDFMYYYSRYENFFAYGNQLVIRANYEELGIEIHTMMVNGYIREYMIYVPECAKTIKHAKGKKRPGSRRHECREKLPVMWVWAGNSQTDKVFIDATAWWKVAREEGFMLVIPCEQYSNTSVSVSHKDSDIFFQQLKDVVVDQYKGDPTRFYSTGQSAGSMLSQTFAIAKPEYFAAIASTSGTPMGWDPSNGSISLDGITYPNSNAMIPNYMICGAGDISMFTGTLWDSTYNRLDSWAGYMLAADELLLGDGQNYEISGWYDRFTTWTWTMNFGGIDVPLFKLGRNVFRSHNCIHEEMPLLWDYARHFSSVVDSLGNVVRYYSPSGFEVAGDQIQIY